MARAGTFSSDENENREPIGRSSLMLRAGLCSTRPYLTALLPIIGGVYVR